MITLVGTSHIANESLVKVKKTIDENKPGVVAVELDILRFKAMQEKKAKKGSTSTKGMPFFARIMVGLMQRLQMKLSAKTGIMPGQEMLDAAIHGKQAGSKVALIDRRINITIDRLMKSMGLFDKIKMISYLVLGFVGLGASGILPKDKSVDLNKIPEDEMIEYAISYLRDSFPSIYKVLVEERNVFMAKAIQHIQSKEEGDIVAVVGAGHVPGMKKILEKAGLDVSVA